MIRSSWIRNRTLLCVFLVMLFLTSSQLLKKVLFKLPNLLCTQKHQYKFTALVKKGSSCWFNTHANNIKQNFAKNHICSKMYNPLWHQTSPFEAFRARINKVGESDNYSDFPWRKISLRLPWEHSIMGSAWWNTCMKWQVSCWKVGTKVRGYRVQRNLGTDENGGLH